MDEMLKKFAELVSPEQKELEGIIVMEGGADKLLKDNRKLTQLLRQGNSGHLVDPVDPAAQSHVQISSELDEFRNELRETPEAAMERNGEKFEAKLKIMEANLAREMEKIVSRSTDRMIDELTKEINKGPQNGIMDRVSFLFHITSSNVYNL
jgi:hypothetical protein